MVSPTWFADQRNIDTFWAFEQLTCDVRQKWSLCTDRLFGRLPTFIITTQTANPVEYFGSHFLESVHADDLELRPWLLYDFQLFFRLCLWHRIELISRNIVSKNYNISVSYKWLVEVPHVAVGHVAPQNPLSGFGVWGPGGVREGEKRKGWRRGWRGITRRHFADRSTWLSLYHKRVTLCPENLPWSCVRGRGRGKNQSSLKPIA